VIICQDENDVHGLLFAFLAKPPFHRKHENENNEKTHGRYI